MSKTSVVHIPQDVTVWKADEVKALLLAALREADRVEVELSAVASVDVTFLQTLCAAQKMAARDGKVLSFPAGRHSGVAELAILLGFPAPTTAVDHWAW